MKRFENQVAIVTGAGRGIGEAIARRLAEEGARIAVVSRTEANARKTAEAIGAVAPDVAKPYAVDVADFDAVQRTVGHSGGFWPWMCLSTTRHYP
jgi:3-oxoacyl-[acyl-carrier protein] reductase